MDEHDRALNRDLFAKKKNENGLMAQSVCGQCPISQVQWLIKKIGKKSAQNLSFRAVRHISRPYIHFN